MKPARSIPPSPAPLPGPQPLLGQRDSRPTPWPLHDSASARALESQAAAALPVHSLMQRAGLGLARLARALRPHTRQALVMAGPGNNGGDGFEAAMRLAQAGWQVRVHFIGDAARLPMDAAASLARARQAGVAIHAGLPDTETTEEPAELVIDALLGRGLRRAVQGPLAEAIRLCQRLRGQGADVLSVDLPSGLPTDTGSPAPGSPCVPATWTLALLSLAPGLFTAQGRDVCGDIWFDDLQVPNNGDMATAWLASGPSLDNAWPARRHAQHKGSFGDLWVVGGAAGMGGAATLAARAALRAGAGRIYVAGLSHQNQTTDPLHPELMHARLQDLLSAPTPWRRGTVVAGCGAGKEIAASLPTLLAEPARLVLDADALNALAETPKLLEGLRERSSRGQASVLTPHPLEAARLLGISTQDVQQDRFAAAQQLAELGRCVVLLKGSGTLVAAPGQLPWLLPVGNAALSTPGSGDVLAGWLGGLWSQYEGLNSDPLVSSRHEPDAARQAAMLAACRAGWHHGRCAELLRPDGRALPASELAEALGTAAARG